MQQALYYCFYFLESTFFFVLVQLFRRVFQSVAAGAAVVAADRSSFFVMAAFGRILRTFLPKQLLLLDSARFPCLKHSQDSLNLPADAAIVAVRHCELYR